MGTNIVLAADEAAEAVFTLKLDGRVASDGSVEISDLSITLDGLKRFLNASTELYFSGGDPGRRIPNGEPLRIQISPPTRGSFETIVTVVVVWTGLTIIQGVLGNRADAAVVWSYGRLKDWFRRTFKTHLEAKTGGIDKEEIARRLLQMVREENPPLAPSIAESPVDAEVEMFEPEEAADAGDTTVADSETFTQKIVEQIDQGIYELAEPVGTSCETLDVEDRGSIPILKIGPAEKEVLRQPLLPPAPSDEWIAAKIRFIRINKETGSCIFRFLDGADVTQHRRGRISDRRLSQPRDAYTQSFSLEQPIDVWMRVRSTTAGGRYYELSLERPEQQSTLFGAA